jgi:hypothetical protein
LSAAGRWQLGVHAARGRIEDLVVIPQVERFTHDVALPGGVVEGSVIDDAREPLAGVDVTLHVERGARPPSPFSSTALQKRTDAEGRFRFTTVPEGTYAVVAHGRAAKDELPALALTAARGIVVSSGSSATPADVRIALVRGEVVTGRVVDENGFAVDQGVVFVRDAEGRVLNPTSTNRIDSFGRFTTAPLAPGPYTLAAWVAGQASAPTEVGKSGQEVELVVRGSAVVLVGLGGLDPSTTVLSVRDGAGNEHANLLDPRRPWDFIIDGFTGDVARIGPLPPSRYLVRGVDASGREGSVTVEIEGPGSVRVDLAAQR